MSNDLFSNLGGLVRGLSSFMPQDDPNTKIFNATNEVNELKQQETKLYAEIGKKAFGEISENPEYAVLVNELTAVHEKLEKAEEALEAAEEEKGLLEKQKEEELEQRTCRNCCSENPPDSKFCQECGAKLGPEPKSICQSCKTENPPGTRFCSECGARI